MEDKTENVTLVTLVISLKDITVDLPVHPVNMLTPKLELVTLVTTLVPLALDQMLTNVFLVMLQTISTTTDVETHVQMDIPETMNTELVLHVTPLV